MLLKGFYWSGMEDQLLQWVFFCRYWCWCDWLADNVCLYVAFFIISLTSSDTKSLAKPTESYELELNYFWLAYEKVEWYMQCVSISIWWSISVFQYVWNNILTATWKKRLFAWAVSSTMCAMMKNLLIQLLDMCMLKWLFK